MSYGKEYVESLTRIKLGEDPFIVRKQEIQASKRIKQGGIDIDGTKVTDGNLKIESGQKVKIGKKIFITIK